MKANNDEMILVEILIVVLIIMGILLYLNPEQFMMVYDKINAFLLQ